MQRVSPYSRQSLDGSSPGLNTQLQHKVGRGWDLQAYTPSSPPTPAVGHQSANHAYQGQSLPRMGRQHPPKVRRRQREMCDREEG